MKITKIKVSNYRLLKDFSMDLEAELSLVIGKNNTGKTSILSILDKFLSSNQKQNLKHKFTFDDFNVDSKKELEKELKKEIVSESDYKKTNIELRVFIEYAKEDDLSNISRVMMDLDPDNNVIVLNFEYTLGYTEYLRLKEDYRELKEEEERKKSDEKAPPQTLTDFLRKNHRKYFKVVKRSLGYCKDEKKEIEGISMDLENTKTNLDNILSFKYIKAKRDVTNKDNEKTLSTQVAKIYECSGISNEQANVVKNFKDKLSKTDVELNEIYKDLFQDVIEEVKTFGGMKINESELEIMSTLRHQELLKANTTVMNKYDADNSLPEHHNGLGYMNLIDIIFEIQILISQFKRTKDQKLADINLLFIEEPEAHTHPQMQYVFIENIKNLLGKGIKRDDGVESALQYIISTHSAHIVTRSNFGDIKYLKRENKGVIAKNLKDLESEYEEEQYQFLKKYLKINQAEIFFADKAIFIEGNTERILMPFFIQRIDFQEEKSAESSNQDLPLLSQKISVIEFGGAYFHIFEKFIEFLGVKTLIVTDIDSIDENAKKCEVTKGCASSNATLNKFFGGKVALDSLKKFSFGQKLFNKMNGEWKKDPNGALSVVYQTEEDEYTGRSFEDAFIHINREYIAAKESAFRGLKNKESFSKLENNAYELADKCIKKKTDFALDILYHSNADLNPDVWKIPKYIKEGLLWLKKD